MIAENWCPSEIIFIWKNLGLSGLCSAYTVGPPTPTRDHKVAKCLKRQCLAHDIKDGYKTLHVDPQCSCEQVQLDVSHIPAILEEGKIPLVSLSFLGDSLEPEIVACGPEVPFVAVSHVWCDGLGNPEHNGLYICQLRKLRDNFRATFIMNSLKPLYKGEYGQAHILDLFSDGGQGSFSPFRFGEKVHFWIDTLCVPLRPDAARKTAIRHMKRCYHDARVVWVLDSSIMRLSANDDPEKILLRIASSPWVRRLWTYHEAELAKKLVFQLSDSGVDVTEIWNEWWETESISFYNRLPYLLPGLVPGFYKLRRLNGNVRFVRLLTNLRWRTTSKLRDEPLCMAGLLDLDVQAILDAPEGEKKMIAFVSLHPEFPSDILFWTTKRVLSEADYAWCPQSFLAAPASDEYWKYSKKGVVNTGKYTVFPEYGPGRVSGFVVNLCGFVFPPELNGPNKDELRYRFRQKSDRTCYRWAPDDLRENQGDIRGPFIGIVMRGPRPFNDTWHGILVTVFHAEGDILFADYATRVRVYEVDDGDDGFGEELVEVNWCGEDQKWCIGSRPASENEGHEDD